MICLERGYATLSNLLQYMQVFSHYEVHGGIGTRGRFPKFAVIRNFLDSTYGLSHVYCEPRATSHKKRNTINIGTMIGMMGAKNRNWKHLGELKS